VRQRLAALEEHLKAQCRTAAQLAVEPEIKAIMLEMLVNCFFGAKVGYDELREVHVPAMERLIDHIVRDTVINRLGLPVRLLSRFSRRVAQSQADFARFEELTDRVLKARHTDRGLWKKFRSDAPDEVLRSNIKVFLAGALEATTSYAAWAISHLARNPLAQENVFQELKDVIDYSPENLDQAQYLGHVLDETLRLTPSLYFLPRRATQETKIETADGRSMVIPKGTHILLDVWHANRHDDHWGVSITGFPAEEFAPDRWANLTERKQASKEMLHFGFGHGARVCPGKHLGQLEVALLVGAFVKLFRFQAVDSTNDVKAGVSTKPLDGTLVTLELRERQAVELKTPEPFC
jgi:cytochrome P450